MDYDRYKLLRDMPDLPKGAVFHYNKAGNWYECHRIHTDWLYAVPREIVEDTEWFDVI